MESDNMYDLKEYKPAVLDLFDLAISLDIGIENEIGHEIFQVSVITPKWLIANCKDNEIFIPRHYLIILQYDYQEIVKKLNQICVECAGVDWNECSSKLSRYFSWEFEDYRDLSPKRNN